MDCPHCGSHLRVDNATCVDPECEGYAGLLVTVEHFGNSTRKLRVLLDRGRYEANGMWHGNGTYDPVTFSLRNGLIVCRGARNWRLTRDSLSLCREAAGLRGPGTLHSFDREQQSKPRKPKDPDPKQTRMF
jgi:hypothetical protein